MRSMETESFNSLVARYLGVSLPDRLADGVSLPEMPIDVRNFIVRMLSLMKRGSYPATDINPYAIRLLSKVIPDILPSAWGGRIPPITLNGRHEKLDEFVAKHTWTSGTGRPVFVDIGCGFPPVTTADTARRMPDWTVYGIDRSFARYLVFDVDGYYALFDSAGDFRYLQAPLNTTPRKKDTRLKAAKARFESLFSDLRPLLKNARDGISETVERAGNKLVSNPIHDFASGNLSFVESSVEGLQLPPARVVRCMNVLPYYTPEVRKKMLVSMGNLLDDDGILMAGFNHHSGANVRYAVCQKAADGGLIPREFAFSPDNLRPLGVAPWYTIHENDPEAGLLAELTYAIRADPIFWPEFAQRADSLMEKHGVFKRENDGFVNFVGDTQTMPAGGLITQLTFVWQELEAEGYTDGAAEALCRAGYSAWKNSVGDVAVRFSETIDAF